MKTTHSGSSGGTSSLKMRKKERNLNIYIKFWLPDLKKKGRSEQNNNIHVHKIGASYQNMDNEKECFH